MANFKTAFDITNKSEGGYANNPDDHGGETYAGISRKNFPNWSGWPHIDEIKTSWKTPKDIDTAIEVSPVPFHQMVQDFYKANFWNPLALDLFDDQQIANAVYDFGVNSGTGTSARKLQTAVGVQADGLIGTNTLGVVNSADPAKTLSLFNELRSAYYHKLADNPGQSQFLASWLSRIKPYQV